MDTMSSLRRLALVFLLAMSTPSCSTLHKVESSERQETEHLAALYDAEFRERYDSIYILEERITNFVHDTLWIKDKSTEYRYRYLRDTAYVERTDTVVRMQEIERVIEREVKSPKSRLRTWLDRIAYSALLLLIFWLVLRIRLPTHL